MGLTFTEHRLEEGFDVFPPPNTNPCPESGLPPLLGDAHPYFPTPSRRARARRNVPPPPAPHPGGAGAGHLSGVPRDSCRWSQRPWLRAEACLPGSPGRARGLPASLPPSPLLSCAVSLHSQTNRVRLRWSRARLGDGCQLSLQSWLHKGKQITKMEIFKLAFSGIQIDVWVARRHRPRSCYFVIKMIPKIPPCFGFHLLKRLVSFPLRISPPCGERQTPDHPRIANIWMRVCWNLAPADFPQELNF